MSHFVTYAIVPKETKNVESWIDTLMAPYSEHEEVEEYEERCYCVGLDAWKEVADAAKKSGKFETGKGPWGKEFEDMERWIQQKLDKHPDRDKPDRKCESCKGTGKVKTTYNPDSKWDWYVVGGRWNGCVRGNPRNDKEGGFNFGDEFHQLKENCIEVKNIPQSPEYRYPYAILGPDGEWYERGKMGYWGISTGNKEKDVWEDDVEQIYKMYPNHIAIGLDCHI